MIDRYCLLCVVIVLLSATCGSAGASGESDARATGQPHLMAQLTPRAFPGGLAVSDDGKIILTDDALWTTDSGTTIRYLPRNARVFSAAISPDKRYLAVGGNDDCANLYDAATGKLLFRLHRESQDTEYGTCEALAFSQDGRFLASGGNRSVVVWDTHTGTAARRWTFGAQTTPWNISVLAFKGNSSTLVMGDSEGMIRFGVITTGKLTYWKDRNAYQCLAISSDGCRAGYLRLSNGGYELVVADLQKKKAIRTIWRRDTLDQTIALPASSSICVAAAKGAPPEVWDIVTGHRLQTLSGISGSEKISMDRLGKRLVAADCERGYICAWDMSTYKLLWAKNGQELLGLRVLGWQGDTLSTLENLNTLAQWELRQGKRTNRCVTSMGSPNSYVWWQVKGSSDGMCIAILRKCAQSDSKPGCIEIALYDGQNGALRWRAGAAPDILSQFVFSSDGSVLACDTGDNVVGLFDTKRGNMAASLVTGLSKIMRLATNADGSRIAAGGKDGTIKVWNVPEQRELFSCLCKPAGYYESCARLGISPDGRYLLTGSGDGILTVWDVLAESKVYEHYLPDRVATNGQDTSSFSIETIKFSADGRLAAITCDDRIYIFDTHTRNIIAVLASDASLSEDSVAFDPTGLHIAAGYIDGSVRIWDIAAGRELCAIYAFPGGSWTVVTPDGRFDADNLENDVPLHWVMPDDPFNPLPIEIFMRDYYEPGLLNKVLNHVPMHPVRNFQTLNRIQPKVEIESINPNGSDTVEVRVVASGDKERFRQDGRSVDLSTEVRDLRLFRDGQLVGYVDGKLALDSEGRYIKSFPVRLARLAGSRQVKFSAYAFNNDMIKSATARNGYTRSSVAAVKGRAYVICVGVNSYQDRTWDLTYAASDADLACEILSSKLVGSGLYADIVSMAMVSDTSSGRDFALKVNFKTVLEALAGRDVPAERLLSIPGSARLRRAEPEDVVLIYWSGHGYVDEMGLGGLHRSGLFYLFGSDIGTNASADDPGTLARGVNSDELSEWLRDVDAGDMVIVIDACHSAASVEGGGFKPGPMGSRGLGQLAYDKGMSILAASQSDGVALEMNKLQHGLLTYAVFEEGLESGMAAKDGQVTMSNLLKWGVERVPGLYDDVRSGKPLVAQGKHAIVVGVLKQDEEKNHCQTPALFDFRKDRATTIVLGNNH